MNAKLDGLCVLVTRPAGRADELLAAVRGAGGQAVHLPLMGILPLDPDTDAETCQQTRARVQQLDNYRHVIFISVNAAQYGLDWIDRFWPQLPVGIRWYAIGAATAAALARADMPVVAGDGAMNSEALLARPELQSVGGERVLIVRGVGGRETLAQTLRQRGAHVDYLQCYQRCCPPLAPDEVAGVLSVEGVNAVCANSAETVDNLLTVLGDAYRQLALPIPLIVPSERVAQRARQQGFARVIVAANAGTPATVDALRALAAEI